MRGVIIGSFALKQHLRNLEINNNGIDFIVDEDTFMKIAFYCSKKGECMDKLLDGQGYKFSIGKDNNYQEMIMKYCNHLKHSKKIKLFGETFIVAPLDLLYIIKKSQLHIKYGNNDNTYKRQMEIYTHLKANINIEKFDYILFGVGKKVSHDIMDSFLKIIYGQGLEYTKKVSRA